MIDVSNILHHTTASDYHQEMYLFIATFMTVFDEFLYSFEEFRGRDSHLPSEMYVVIVLRPNVSLVIVMYCIYRTTSVIALLLYVI